MKTAAVICEYNPFHYGHKYQLEQTRKAGATHIVAVMSGNFTQRGDIAVFDKYQRARTALENGVDLVLELPTRYSLSSAERFARGAVEIISALGVADMLSFGCECGDIEALKEAAGASEYAVHSDEFFTRMKSGMSYPSALAETVKQFYTPDVYDVLCSPNNTLAVEYIKALDDIGSPIETLAIKRNGAPHDSNDLQSGFASASVIREKILSGGEYADFAPVINDDHADIKNLETAILAKLRMMKKDDFSDIYDANQGLGEKLYKASRIAGNLDELYFLTKSKAFTLARIRRAVLCGFLGIDKKQLLQKSAYIRILGMNSKGREILSAAKDTCTLPIDTSLKALMKTGKEAFRQGTCEERYGNIYALAFEKPKRCGGEFTAKPVIID